MTLRDQLAAEMAHGKRVREHFGPLPTGEGPEDYARLLAFLHQEALTGAGSARIPVNPPFGADYFLMGMTKAYGTHFYDGKPCSYPNRSGPADYLRRFAAALAQVEPDLKLGMDVDGSLTVEW